MLANVNFNISHIHENNVVTISTLGKTGVSLQTLGTQNFYQQTSMSF